MHATAPQPIVGHAEPAPTSAPITVVDDTPEWEWDAFTSATPSASVEQLSAWRHIFAEVFGHSPVYLTALRQGRVVGALPMVRLRSMLFGRSLLSLPFANYAGLMTTEEEVARALVDRAEAIGREWGAGHVELRNVHRHLPELPWRSHKVGARLALASTPEAVWTSLDKKVRNQVRKAQKASLTVHAGGAELLDEFYAVFARNMRDLGTPVFPRALFTATLHRLAASARVWVVRHGSVAVAGGIALSWRDTVLVPWASSLREARHLCPNMLLYWAMIEAAAAAGYAVFDFGRSTPGGGTHQFKQQWGCTDVPLHWEYALLSRRDVPEHGPTNPRIQRVVSAWQQLPLRVANTLGPHLSRHLA